jgi:hypothetical protein
MEPHKVTAAKKSISRTSKRGDLSLALRKKDSFKEWDIDGEYKFEKILGQGSYGSRLGHIIDNWQKSSYQENG